MEKEKDVQKLNQKYVDLLKKSFEKYSKISILETDDVNKIDIHYSDKIEKDVLRKSPVVDRRPRVSSSSRPKKKEFHTKITKNGRKIFSSEEDRFLLNFVSENPDFEENKTLKLRSLEGLMNRSTKAIDCRIRNLQKGKNKNQRTHKTFSLTEDKVIIDKAIKHLKKCQVLRETIIKKPRKLAEKLNRNYLAVEQRWSIRIRSWLLQYYNKNLNLEIRPMLADLLSKHFNSVHMIDWKFVSCHTEFAGHTEISLRNQFHSRILRNAAQFLQKPRDQVSLKEIADYTKENIGNQHFKINSNVERRQIECIDYFVKQIKKKNISFQSK